MARMRGNHKIMAAQYILIAKQKQMRIWRRKTAAKTKAEELIQQLKDGAELAKANSADTGTAAKVCSQIGPSIQMS